VHVRSWISMGREQPSIRSKESEKEMEDLNAGKEGNCGGL
jgi:hypothetical protein